MKAVLVIATEHFNETEFTDIKDELVSAGVEVQLASSEGGECIGSEGMRIEGTMKISEIKGQSADALVLIGGGGCLENASDQNLLDLCQEFIQEKVFGAICLGPRIPLYEGLLDGYNVTGWDGDGELSEYIDRGNAQRVNEPVVTDRNVVTGNGPDAAKEMGKQLVFKLSN